LLSIASGDNLLPEVLAGASGVHSGGTTGLASDSMQLMMQMTAGLGSLYTAWRAVKARRRQRRHPGPMRRYQRANWSSTFLDWLTPFEFRRMFGLTQPAFDALLEKIYDDIVDYPSGTWGGVRNAPVVAPALKLAITLRWLRGGSHHDLRLLFGVSRPTIYRTTVRVMRAICAHHELPLPAAATAAAAGDDSLLKKLALGFGAKTMGVFGMCVGAIDGVQVRPHRREQHACPHSHARGTQPDSPDTHRTRSCTWRGRSRPASRPPFRRSGSGSRASARRPTRPST